MCLSPLIKRNLIRIYISTKRLRHNNCSKKALLCLYRIDNLSRTRSLDKLRTLLELSRNKTNERAIYTSTKTSRKDNKLALRLVCLSPLIKRNLIRIYISTKRLRHNNCSKKALLCLYRIDNLSRTRSLDKLRTLLELSRNKTNERAIYTSTKTSRRDNYKLLCALCA